MTRQEFTFTIGFQGDTAIVDKRAMRQYGRLSIAELAEKGLYRAAFCSALYSDDGAELEEFVRLFGEKTSAASGQVRDKLSAEQLKRLFGVYAVPDEIKRVVSL